MTSPVVGHARIEYEADLGAFAATSRAKVDQAMAGVKDSVDKGLGAAQTTARTRGEGTGKAFADGVDSGSKNTKLGENATKSADEAEAQAKTAFDRVGRALGVTFAGKMLDGVGTGRLGLSRAIEGLAETAGSIGETKMGEAGRKAGEKFTDSAKEGLHSFGGVILGAVGSLGAGEIISESIKAAGADAAAVGKVKNVFGEASGEVAEFGEKAVQTFGITTAAADKSAAVFGQYLKSFGIGGEEAAKMSTQLVGVTQNVAAFNKADPAAVQDAIAAGLRGRGAALRQYGIDLSATKLLEEGRAHGLLNEKGQLDAAAKGEAAYYAILDQTKGQMGAVAARAGTLGFEKQKLTAQVDTLEAHLGTALIPKLAQLAAIMNNDVIPAVEAVGGWIQKNSSWLEPLAGAIVGIVVAWKAWNVVMAVWTAISEASPILLIISAIVALGVALVVAYEKSATFRNIVQAVWRDIQTVVRVAWNDVIKPALDGLRIGFEAVWRFLQAAWTTVGRPLFDTIRTVIGAVIAGALAVFTALRVAWSATWTAVMAVWHVAEPIIRAIGLIIYAVLGVAVLAVFTLVRLAWQAMWTLIKTWWDAIGHPLFIAIQTVVGWFYNNVIAPTFTLIRLAWETMWTLVKTVWDSVGYPIFTTIQSVIDWLYNNVLKKTFDDISSAWSGLWNGMKSVFGDIWGGIESVITGGVNGIIDIINGFIGAINWVLGKLPGGLSIGTIGHIGGGGGTFVGQANGTGGSQGRTEFDSGGWTGPGSKYQPAGVVHADEFVFTKEQTSKAGVSNLYALANRLNGYAGGGLVGALTGGLTTALGVVDPVAGLFNEVTGVDSALISAGVQTAVDAALNGAESAARGAIAAVPSEVVRDVASGVYGQADKWLRDLVNGKAKTARDAAAAASASIGGPATGTQLQYAAEIGGIAKSMGLGRQGALIALETALTESGLRNLANSNVPESLSYPHDGVGSDHDSVNMFQQRAGGGYWGSLAELMNPQYSIQRFFQELLRKVPGYAGMDPGVAAQTVQVSAFPDAYDRQLGAATGMLAAAGFDSGGWMMPGRGMYDNGTRQPEAVLTAPQWRVAEQAITSHVAGPATAPQHTEWHITQRPNEDAAALARRIDAEQEWKARSEGLALA